MPRKRELAYNPLVELPRTVQPRAATAIQALMEAPPYAPIENSIEELLPLRTVLADALDALPERDRWIINSILIERKSIRSTAADLSLAKSHVDRLYKTALNTLRNQLATHPQIQEYLDCLKNES